MATPDKYDKQQDTAISNLSSGKVTKGGDSDGAVLKVGTLDAQDVQIVHNNIQKIFIQSFQTSVQGNNQVYIQSMESSPQPTSVYIMNGATDMITCSGENQVTIHKPVAMSSQQIKGMADPTIAQDAATKNYIDTRVLNDLSDVTITGVTTDDYLRWSGTHWVNLQTAYALARWENNATSSLGVQNNVNWIQGTFAAGSLLKSFTIGANNGFTYTGTSTRTFLVNVWATPIVTSNDRTIQVTCWLNPSALLNPTGSHIIGSRTISIVRTSINDTDSCSAGFYVSLATNDLLRFYVSNTENNDPVTISDISVRITPLI